MRYVVLITLAFLSKFLFDLCLDADSTLSPVLLARDHVRFLASLPSRSQDIARCRTGITLIGREHGHSASVDNFLPHASLSRVHSSHVRQVVDGSVSLCGP